MLERKTLSNFKISPADHNFLLHCKCIFALPLGNGSPPSNVLNTKKGGGNNSFFAELLELHQFCILIYFLIRWPKNVTAFIHAMLQCLCKFRGQGVNRKYLLHKHQQSSWFGRWVDWRTQKLNVKMQKLAVTFWAEISFSWETILNLLIKSISCLILNWQILLRLEIFFWKKTRLAFIPTKQVLP